MKYINRFLILITFILLNNTLLFSQYGLQKTEISGITNLNIPNSESIVVLSDKDKFNKLRKFVKETMEYWKVPGMAISIVRNNEIIFSEGFGLRDVENNLPVTKNTLFAIGSSTKSFGTMLLGMLEDDGKLKLDDKVLDHLPDFEMYDNFVSERMTIRDLITHRSGLPRHDFVAIGSDFTRKEIVSKLKFLQPNKSFRTDFQYQNLMFITAGYLAGQVEKSTWEELVQNRIFNPLGMERSNFDINVMKKDDNFSNGYEFKDDKVLKMDFFEFDSAGPAGSINSSAEEMAEWLKLHLNNGVYNEDLLISKGLLTQMHTPFTTINSPVTTKVMSHTAYGLGWFIQTYQGKKRVQHGGNIDGFSALVTLYPQESLGIVVLTNLNTTPLRDFASLYAEDLMFDRNPFEWHKRSKDAREKAKDSKVKIKVDDGRVKDTNPSHPLNDYVGDYEDEAYGIISIEEYDGRLVFKRGKYEFDLEHWHYDIFNMTEGMFKGRKVSFKYNLKGEIYKIKISVEPAVKDAEFTRIKPDKKN